MVHTADKPGAGCGDDIWPAIADMIHVIPPSDINEALRILRQRNTIVQITLHMLDSFVECRVIYNRLWRAFTCEQIDLLLSLACRRFLGNIRLRSQASDVIFGR